MLSAVVRAAAAVSVAGGLAFAAVPAVHAAAGRGAAADAWTIAGGTAVSARAAASGTVRASQQWVFNMIDVWPAWQRTEGAGVTVAVLDSGVNPRVSDLANSVITGPDLTGLSTAPSNPNWGVHGTWMASIIAGHGHNSGLNGVLGIAPQAKILSIRVIPEKADPEYHQYAVEPEQRIQKSLATGIRDAAKDGAEVISMSLGYTAPSAAVQSAIQYAFARGVVLVASAGNAGGEPAGPGAAPTSGNAAGNGNSGRGFAPVSFPAQYPGVLSVAAVNQNGSVASFSSDNLSVEVAAPGKDITAQGRGGQYWSVSGTSPACALVAGVAALIKSRYPALAPDLVLRAITSTAREGRYGGYNAKTGFGVVDAAAALNEAGRLARTRAAGPRVAASTRFGGGPAAIPPAPVSARGSEGLVRYAMLAVVSLAVVLAGGLWLGRVRRGRGRRGYRAVPGIVGSGGAHAAYFGPAGTPPACGVPPGPGRPPFPGPGRPGFPDLGPPDMGSPPAAFQAVGTGVTASSGRIRVNTTERLADDYSARVLDVIDEIPPGKVMSYGDIAEYIGSGGPRQVGRVMSAYGGGVAWWRVIHADGTPPPGHDSAALARYLEEGTPLCSDRPPVRVDMSRARWKG